MGVTGTQSAQRQGQSTWMTMIVGMGLAAAIVCTGTLLASGVRQKGGELVVRQVFQSEEDLHAQESKLLQGKTIAFLKEYAFAFADAAIRFETVPKLDTKLFYAIVTAMPEDVEVTALAFDGYDLVMDCSSANEGTWELFAHRLSESASVGTVTQSEVQAESGEWHYQITCSSPMEHGQLYLPGAAETMQPE